MTDTRVSSPFVDQPMASGPRARLAAWLLRRAGWRCVLARPVPTHCVVVIYPHTSNWDFPLGLLMTWMVGIHFRFVAKDSLFFWPFGGLFRRWGGIAVNRRERTGFIDQLVTMFATEEEFRLSLTPEGTRRRTEHWKSGFYHLARAVRVPLAMGFIDYSRREVGIGAYLTLTGEVGVDMARIAAFYADKVGRHPEEASPIRLADDVPPG